MNATPTPPAPTAPRRLSLQRFVSLSCVVIAVVVLFTASRVFGAEAPKPDSPPTTDRLFHAIEQGDYHAAVAVGSPTFQQLSRVKFDGVSAQLRTRMKAGHQVAYLGDLRQREIRVHLWKVSFQDGSDDALVTLSVKNGTVVSFAVK